VSTADPASIRREFPEMSTCPSLEDLLRIDSEAVGESTFSRLEQHLETCPRCRDALQLQLDSNPDQSTLIGPESGRFSPGPPPVPGYRVDRELGRGGMGIVYLASRESDGRPVALKFLGGGPEDRARWRREARAMAAVDHPGVVRLFELVEAGPWTCLVLEYIPGGRLEDRLDGSPSPRHAAELVEAVARAIHQVHLAGLLHLDLKPSNILLEGGPEVPLPLARPRVADFGLALPWGDADASWTLAAGPRGTPSYMAPEQLAPTRATIGPAADIYALGALLYRILAGRPPVLAGSKLESYLQLRDHDPVPPRRLNPKVPAALETICLACLRKDPSRRYGSALELADDLRRFLDGLSIRMRPTPAPVRLARWGQRNPALAVSLAAVLLLSTFAFALLLVLAREARLDADRAEARRLADARNGDLATQAAVLGFQDVSQDLLFSPDLIAANAAFTESMIQLESQFETCRLDGVINDANLRLQGILQREISRRLIALGNYPAGEAQWSRSRNTLEFLLRQHPDDLSFREQLIITLIDQAVHQALDFVDDVDDRIDLLGEIRHHAEFIYEATGQLLHADSQITMRIDLADHLRRVGQTERARELVAENRWFIDRLPDHQPRNIHLMAALASTASWLGDLDESDRFAAEAVRLLTEDPTTDLRSTFSLRSWFLRPDGPLGSIIDDLHERPRSKDADDWARGIEEAIHADLERLGTKGPTPPALRIAIARWHVDLLFQVGVGFRRLGRLEDSSRVADVQMVLGNWAVARHPDDAEAHSLVREASRQLAKIHIEYSKRNDDRMVEHLSQVVFFLKRAEVPARRAAELEPTSATHLRNLQRVEADIRTWEATLAEQMASVEVE
jgi:hypothetical protein